MQLTLIFISIAFIILSVWYSNQITAKYDTEKSLLLRVGVTLVIVLLAMWIVDIVIFGQIKLLEQKTREEIVAMIKNLFVALVIAIIVNEKIKK